MRTRLAVYREQTQPLVDFYQGLAEAGELRYARIDGVGDVEQIRERTIEAVLPGPEPSALSAGWVVLRGTADGGPAGQRPGRATGGPVDRRTGR